MPDGIRAGSISGKWIWRGRPLQSGVYLNLINDQAGARLIVRCPGRATGWTDAAFPSHDWNGSRLIRQRIFPAIDIPKSATRREELLRDPVEMEQVSKLRRKLAQLQPIDAARELVEALEKYPTNKELLAKFSPTR